MYKRKAIIFDIDGTLANNEHRQHFLIEETKNWEEFFRNMSKDSPIEPIRTVCASLIANREMVRSLVAIRRSTSSFAPDARPTTEGRP